MIIMEITIKNVETFNWDTTFFLSSSRSTPELRRLDCRILLPNYQKPNTSITHQELPWLLSHTKGITYFTEGIILLLCRSWWNIFVTFSTRFYTFPLGNHLLETSSYILLERQSITPNSLTIFSIFSEMYIYMYTYTPIALTEVSMFSWAESHLSLGWLAAPIIELVGSLDMIVNSVALLINFITGNKIKHLNYHIIPFEQN